MCDIHMRAAVAVLMLKYVKRGNTAHKHRLRFYDNVARINK